MSEKKEWFNFEQWVENVETVKKSKIIINKKNNIKQWKFHENNYVKNRPVYKKPSTLLHEEKKLENKIKEITDKTKKDDEQQQKIEQKEPRVLYFPEKINGEYSNCTTFFCVEGRWNYWAPGNYKECLDHFKKIHNWDLLKIVNELSKINFWSLETFISPIILNLKIKFYHTFFIRINSYYDEKKEKYYDYWLGINEDVGFVQGFVFEKKWYCDEYFEFVKKSHKWTILTKKEPNNE